MTSEKLKVANLMCSGCVNAIKTNLLKLTGMKEVQVDLENKIITISYDNIEKSTITNLLSTIGYPEVSE